VSAIGQVGDLYVQNYKSVEAYEGAVARGALPSHQGTRMTVDDRIRRDIINQLMCHGCVEIAAVERRHQLEFGTYFRPELEKLRALERDGLVDLGGGDIVLTPVGRLLMRNVAMTFDAYLTRNAAPVPMSRVI